VVALRASEARRLGVPVDPSAFTARVATANGEIAAARVRLASLEVENIRVANVDAVVLPDEALGTNLLGMSFLKRLSRFEVGDNRLLMVE
jgi:clan AA aspartic protease, TIGR02281 family